MGPLKVTLTFTFLLSPESNDPPENSSPLKKSLEEKLFENQPAQSRLELYFLQQIPQLAPTNFVAWQVAHAGGNTHATRSFNLQCNNFDKKCYPYYRSYNSSDIKVIRLADTIVCLTLSVCTGSEENLLCWSDSVPHKLLIRGENVTTLEKHLIWTHIWLKTHGWSNVNCSWQNIQEYVRIALAFYHVNLATDH